MRSNTLREVTLPFTIHAVRRSESRSTLIASLALRQRKNSFTPTSVLQRIPGVRGVAVKSRSHFGHLWHPWVFVGIDSSTT